jgi:hypothetical protein
MSFTQRRFDPFRNLTPEERAQHLDAYRHFLNEREGEPDARRRTCDRRERRMLELEGSPAVVWTGAVDRVAFRRCMAGERDIELDARTAWVLAAAKANEGERYGVDLELARYFERGGFAGVHAQDLMLYAMIQEAYHCRLLVEICKTCDVEFTWNEPGWTTRALMALIGRLPGQLRWIPVMAGEMVGTAVFRLLYRQVDLFEEQPAVRDRLRRIVKEIWVDEVLHVAFARAHLGRPGLAAVRAMVPLVARATLHDAPQLRKLGCTPERILDALEPGVEIPPEIDWLAADAPGALPLSA